MIVTITLNAALDRTLRVPNLQVGVRHRAEWSMSLPGGKGVNVARALKRLGQPVIAAGLAGGRVGTQIIEELTAEGILNDFVRIGEESRTSTAVIDPMNNLQTEINEAGPSVTEAELSLFMDKVRYLGRGADLFVVAGSLPPETPQDIYAELITELASHEAVTAVDTAGPPLRAALSARPGVVSPNVREAEEIVGHEFSDVEERGAGAVAMCEMGAETALIHGEDGCVAHVRGRGARRGRTYAATLGRSDEPVSTVGSGDSFLAGYVAARYEGASDEAALSLAVACGAANTRQYGAGVFDPDDVGALRRQVQVRELG